MGHQISKGDNFLWMREFDEFELTDFIKIIKEEDLVKAAMIALRESKIKFYNLEDIYLSIIKSLESKLEILIDDEKEKVEKVLKAVKNFLY